MNNTYTEEQLKKDLEIIKNQNENLQKRIDDLNDVLGNLKVEFPDMLIYKNGDIFLNKNFNFDNSFVSKEEVIEIVGYLKQFSKDVVEGEQLIKDALDTINMNKKDDN